MWWKAIILSLFCASVLGFAGWLIYHVGRWDGRRSMRRALGIAGQRRLKIQEMLVHDANTIFLTEDVDDRRIRAEIWMSEYQRWSR